MPPMTSRRPGARLTRIGRAKSNSADSSLRVRDRSVGTGSRLRSSRPGLRGKGCGSKAVGSEVAGSGRGEGGWGEGVGTALVLLLLLAFQDDLVEEPPAAGELKLRRQHVRPRRHDQRALELEEVRAAGAVPAVALLVERLEISDPRVRHARPASLGVEWAVIVQLEDHAAGRLRRI